MYHTVVDVTGSDIKNEDIAILEINPLYIDRRIIRQYK